MNEIFTDGQLKKIEDAFKLGASKAEVCVDVPVSKEDLARWLSVDGNDERMKDLRVSFLWEAKKLFHKPKDHREAESLLKSHPDSKDEYNPRLPDSNKYNTQINVFSDEQSRLLAERILQLGEGKGEG